MEFDDATRLKALADYRVLDSPSEDVFDNITRLASSLFAIPIVLVSLVDATRQWFKSRVGLSIRETRREFSFCAHAIVADATLVVPDATQDQRFANNPLVTGEPGIRFYCGVPLRTPEGHGLGTLCIMDRVPRTISTEDIATLEALARQVELELEIRRRFVILQEAFEAQQRRQRSKELLAAMIVHDMRSPLSTLVLLGSVVRAADDASSANLQNLLAEAERIRRMLTDVLDVCLHETGTLRLRAFEFPLAPLIHSVAKRLDRLARQRDQRITVELPDDPVMIHADPQLIERVLENLVGNAIQHGPALGTIDICVSIKSTNDTSKGDLRCEVRDCGEPIPSEYRGRIFEALETLDGSDRGFARGYGLGLAFCRLAIEAHGGSIAAGVAPDGGNCFYFDLASSGTR